MFALSHFLYIWTWKCVRHLSQQRVWQSPHNFQNTFRQLLTLTLVSRRNSVRLYFGSLKTRECFKKNPINLSQKTKKSPFMLGENRSIDVHIHIISFTLNNSWAFLSQNFFAYLTSKKSNIINMVSNPVDICKLLWKCRSGNPELSTLSQCGFIPNKLN